MEVNGFLERRSFMKKNRILLVEDHPIAQKMVSGILQSINCQVDIAGDGKTALSQVYNKNYDLIFMDIGLPDMDGHKVTMKIREYQKNSRHIPIIALTAHVNDSEKAMAANMDGFYGKPLTLELAKEILNQYIK